MAHVQNVNLFHRVSNSTLENTLVLFTGTNCAFLDKEYFCNKVAIS